METAGYQVLTEKANPEIYRRNSFRVAGLSIDSSPRDIARQAKMLRLSREYGDYGASKPPLALLPRPEDHEIREALYNLEDPEQRLIDELFWFWPMRREGTEDDSAISLLASGDIHGAAAHWTAREGSFESPASIHNFAVLHHCLALDLEASAAAGPDSDPSTLRERYWEDAIRGWKRLIECDAFWDELIVKIRSLSDPRLTTGLSRRIRESIPAALFSINAALAVRCAEAGRRDDAKRHIGLLRKWEGDGDGGAPFGPIAEQAMRNALLPIRRRIDAICERTDASARADPSGAVSAAREAIVGAEGSLAVFDLLIPPGSIVREAAHDAVALCAVRCDIAFCNETKGWRDSLALLKIVQGIAEGEAARARIQENISIDEGMILETTCWYCKNNDAVESKAVQAKLHGNVTSRPQYNGVHWEWQHSTINVPRCAHCYEVHVGNQVKLGGGVLATGVIGAILFSAITIPGGFGESVVFGTTLSVASSLFLLLGGLRYIRGTHLEQKRREGVLPHTCIDDFPPIRRLLDSGWAWGERPPNI
jgi:hypothetical protein